MTTSATIFAEFKAAILPLFPGGQFVIRETEGALHGIVHPSLEQRERKSACLSLFDGQWTHEEVRHETAKLAADIRKDEANWL